MIKLTLADGQTIENLTQNGDNFISLTKIDESIFAGNLETVTIENDETDMVTILHNVEFVKTVGPTPGWYFAFRKISDFELAQINNDLAITELYEMLLGGEE